MPPRCRRWEQDWRLHTEWHDQVCPKMIEQDALTHQYLSALNPTYGTQMTPQLMQPLADTNVWSNFKYQDCNGGTYLVAFEPLVRPLLRSPSNFISRCALQNSRKVDDCGLAALVSQH